MDRKAFGKYLEDKHLASATIRNYCSYVEAFERDFGMLAEQIVRSNDTMARVITEMPTKLKVSPNSFSSYAQGLRMYYEYKNMRRYEDTDEQHFQTVPVGGEKSWYKEVLVSDVNEWWQFVRELSRATGCCQKGGISDPRCWAFRGQGDAAWGLESSLGRLAKYGEDDQAEIGRRLRSYEQEAMWTFRREASKKLEYRDLTHGNLLALMQHYGCKTRLLDFTMAPLVAMYMAVEQTDSLLAQVNGYAKAHPGTTLRPVKSPDLALWAVNLNSLAPKHNSDKRERTVIDLAEQADRALDAEAVCQLGIIPLFPTSCNERISAQEGLFLMPRSLDHSFEENLQVSIEETMGKQECLASDLRTAKDEPRPAVYKFVFASALTAEIRRLLLDANVTAKNIYPDLTGLGLFVSSEMTRHGAR